MSYDVFGLPPPPLHQNVTLKNETLYCTIILSYMSWLPLQSVGTALCKPKYGSIWSCAPDSCCILSVPLCIAGAPLENGVKEGCSYSDSLIILKLLLVFMKKKEKLEIHDWNNNYLQVGCFITSSFKCVDGEAAGEAAGGVKHLNVLSGFQCVLLCIVTSFIATRGVRGGGGRYGISRGIEEIASRISRG